jgi:ABC-type sugar transport system permease subunit
MIHIVVLLASIAGAQITFYLIHKKRWSPVRASSGSSLALALLTSFLASPLIASMNAAFFGATFVGMTSEGRMGKKRVFLASLLFALIFTFVIPLLKGIGGGLGTAAFVSSCSVYFAEKIFRSKLRK